MLFKYVLILILFNFSSIHSLGNYFLAGSLKLQRLNSEVLSTENLTYEYYDQQLDHFNEAVNLKWKQVKNCYSFKSADIKN